MPFSNGDKNMKKKELGKFVIDFGIIAFGAILAAAAIYFYMLAKAQRIELITIVDKHEYRKLMDFVKKTDPKAFVTVYSVNEIRY